MTHKPEHKKRKVFDPSQAPSATNRPSGGLVGGTKFDEFRQGEKEAKGTSPSKARAEVAAENLAETARIKGLPGAEELRAKSKRELQGRVDAAVESTREQRARRDAILAEQQATEEDDGQESLREVLGIKEGSKTDVAVRGAIGVAGLATGGGAALAGVKGAKLLGTAGKSLRVSPIQKIFAREKTIASIRRKFMVRGKLLPRKSAENIADIYEKQKKSKLGQFLDPLSPRNLKSTKGIIGLGGVASVAHAGGIAAWYAVDNIISGESIFLRDTVNDVIAGRDTYDNAINTFEIAQQDIDKAENFVNVNTRINPLLWPVGKFYRNGLQAQQRIIDGHRARLERAR